MTSHVSLTLYSFDFYKCSDVNCCGDKRSPSQFQVLAIQRQPAPRPDKDRGTSLLSTIVGTRKLAADCMSELAGRRRTGLLCSSVLKHMAFLIFKPAKPGKNCGNKASIAYENMLPDNNSNPYPTREQCYITCTKTANSNQEHAILINKKVILVELGMDVSTETFLEKIGVLWDEFWGHFAEIVKKYCLSLTFLCPEIIPGGLTPAAQPLDKVITKIFKGHFRDLCDLYIIPDPIRKT